MHYIFIRFLHNKGTTGKGKLSDPKAVDGFTAAIARRFDLDGLIARPGHPALVTKAALIKFRPFGDITRKTVDENKKVCA
jgi:hypothetical protein